MINRGKMSDRRTEAGRAGPDTKTGNRTKLGTLYGIQLGISAEAVL